MHTSGCPWSKATVKSPVGAHDLRPVWSFISFIWPLPCPPCPAPCPARQTDRRTLPCPLSGRPALPCAPALPLPCKTDRTASAWVGHVIRCVILKTQSVGLLPLGDESLVSKRSWEASCMSAALKKRGLLFGERFSPFILIHRQNRFCHRKCRGRFCQWIKMQNCRQTHARTHRLREFILVGTWCIMHPSSSPPARSFPLPTPVLYPVDPPFLRIFHSDSLPRWSPPRSLVIYN